MEITDFKGYVFCGFFAGKINFSSGEELSSANQVFTVNYLHMEKNTHLLFYIKLLFKDQTSKSLSCQIAL